ncbi:MAG: hypothetical protein JST26_11755 [Bacteroidetes bacterium]|nr:hypothetical protein [Bacteroidota bacterium]
MDINGDSIYYVNSRGQITNIGTFQWGPASNEGWKEGEKFGYSTLLSIPDGEALIKKYANSKVHDIYLMESDFPTTGPASLVMKEELLTPQYLMELHLILKKVVGLYGQIAQLQECM